MEDISKETINLGLNSKENIDLGLNEQEEFMEQRRDVG